MKSIRSLRHRSWFCRSCSPLPEPMLNPLFKPMFPLLSRLERRNCRPAPTPSTTRSVPASSRSATSRPAPRCRLWAELKSPSKTDGKLIFHHYGSQYLLAEIWGPGQPGNGPCRRQTAEDLELAQGQRTPAPPSRSPASKQTVMGIFNPATNPGCPTSPISCEAQWVPRLHAPFLKERRTRGLVQCSVQEIRGISLVFREMWDTTALDRKAFESPRAIKCQSHKRFLQVT